MNESKSLRVLADKLDEMESLKAYPSEITDPGQVTVTWTESQDHEGYAAMSAAISNLVGQHWNALRSQVLKSKEGEVQVARTASIGFSTGSGTGTAELPPANAADGGVRRFG